ncbi:MULTISPECIES: non-homologous end-joining DNA ligase [unclassified Streptomyces]|uniref:non-homologous end-joining DNA ligase n=1 Tax=unclassified Streptomyces TaxID=2593676 RepID=UPI002257A8AF|nr:MULTISPECIES: non-homologous end-joining DNA ligase [unclassified Streptomyces]MCX5330262.1 non-homologous end-joining DNA ligase [Streptomyces sp. NBC_00140]MCX5359662.1 non-homologous end-joining DNA ligase [Streptomyces sp. NBC_00124]
MSKDATGTVRAGRRTVEVHRPEKVLFPGDGAGKEYTKSDLVDYYRAVAPFMLPHLRGRPLMLERLPDGVGGPRFMQKNTPDSYPDWISRVEVTKEGGTVRHTVCDDTATLVYLADQACLTLHRWLSRVGRVEQPDRMVFDLDPFGDDFAPVHEAAWLLAELLDELKLPSALMTTGSRGLHVVVPVTAHHDFDEVREFAKDVADTLAAAHPEKFTTAARKKDRGERLYLDIQRNAYAQTAVVPFTVRAKPGAPVATPMSWTQLDDPGLDARRWSIEDAVEQARTNPWAGVMTKGRALGPARRRLNALRG